MDIQQDFFEQEKQLLLPVVDFEYIRSDSLPPLTADSAFLLLKAITGDYRA